jgi:hypothetical protein
MNHVIVPDDPASSIREFFLQNEVLLDEYTLLNSRRFYFGSGRGPTLQLDRHFIDRDGDLVMFMGSRRKTLVLGYVDLFMIVNPTHTTVRQFFPEDEAGFPS